MNEKRDAMENETSWIRRNRHRKIHSLIDKSLILEALSLYLEKSRSVEEGYFSLRRRAEHVEFKFSMKDAMSREAFDKLFLPIINDDDYQNNFIDGLIHSRLYREFISELLYNSIRDFILEENQLLQKVPVAGKLIRAGQNMATNTFSKFSSTSEKFETIIKGFIKRNIHVTERYTYFILKRSVTPLNIENAADFIWETFKDQEVVVDEDFFPQTRRRFNKVFIQLAEGAIDGFLRVFGNKTIAELLY